MKNKIKLFINNNINSISFGLLNGFTIFIGMFLLATYYLIPKEIETAITQLINNSLIYIPYYILDNNSLSNIMGYINQTIVSLLNDKIQQEKKIDLENKKTKKTFFIILLVIGILIISLVFINYFIYHNIKNFNKDLFSLAISIIVILLFEFLFMNVIILKYWYIVIYDIINFVSDNICLSSNANDCKNICTVKDLNIDSVVFA
jgi:hypothetical protein